MDFVILWGRNSFFRGLKLLVSRRASVVTTVVAVSAFAVELAWTTWRSSVLVPLPVVIVATTASSESSSGWSHFLLFDIQLEAFKRDVVLKIYMRIWRIMS